MTLSVLQLVNNIAALSNLIQKMTKLDISILENCRRFRIPAFIVRTKADNHIRKAMAELGYTKKRKDEKARFYTEACEKFVSDTRRNLDDNLGSANLPTQPVYIISSETLRSVANGNHTEKIIDEGNMIRDVLQAAYDRRYGAPHETPEQHTQIVEEYVAAARQAVLPF
jgi:hypothetical protein